MSSEAAENCDLPSCIEVLFLAWRSTEDFLEWSEGAAAGAVVKMNSETEAMPSCIGALLAGTSADKFLVCSTAWAPGPFALRNSAAEVNWSPEGFLTD